MSQKERLKGAISELLEELNLNQSQLAKLIGLRPGNITDWMKGRSKPSGPALMHLAELARSDELKEEFYRMAGISRDLGNSLWTFKRAGNTIGATKPGSAEARPLYFPGKPQLKPEASMEMIVVPCVPFSFISSPLNQINSLDFKLRFPINFEREQLYKIDPLGIWICTRMASSDESMVPTVLPGELLLINKRFSIRSRLMAGNIFLVRLDGEVTVRRLIGDKGPSVLIADNHRYPSRAVKNAELEKLIIGQVLWKGGELK